MDFTANATDSGTFAGWTGFFRRNCHGATPKTDKRWKSSFSQIGPDPVPNLVRSLSCYPSAVTASTNARIWSWFNDWTILFTTKMKVVVPYTCVRERLRLGITVVLPPNDFSSRSSNNAAAVKDRPVRIRNQAFRFSHEAEQSTACYWRT